MKRLALICATIAISFAIPAPAYYHFVHYLSTGNAPEKFDLSALPNQTVTFFVSEAGPTAYSSTDTFNSVLGQIQQAARVWNGVASSAIRVSFGGLENAATTQNTPGGDVLFEDLPPGVEGFGGPTSLANPVTVTAADGSQSQFFPIVRSALYLNQNLTLPPGPSFNQSFFMTTLHEMGHALGLQHTFTSSTMSQATTRATNLTHPLDTDDIASLSTLYPGAGFAQQVGSITGQITAGGNGVHLASVVAIQAGSGAIGGVTNPDGSFRIDGVPPGNYLVYVHTMPPDANIIGPWNADGSVAAASGPVNALFYPGTTSLSAATPVQVQAGTVTSGINISTTTRAAVPFYDGQIYAYLNGTIAITPAPVNMSAVPPIAASVTGLGSNGQIPGLNVNVIGGMVAFGNRPYAATVNGTNYTYAALYPTIASSAQPGPQHVIFTTPDYMYVLPSGIYLAQNAPPLISSVTANGDGTLTVAGSNWASNTMVYFDSLPSTGSLNPTTGVSVVTPPAGSNNQVATVTAYNSDGQNSQFIQSAAPVQYSYGSAPAPQITSINPASLPAGADAMVDITATGVNFVQGLTAVGFGTTDVVVRNIFVLSSNHLQVNVSVSPNAALATSDLSVITGFQLATLTGAFQVTAFSAGLPAPIPDLINALPGLTGSYAGAIVSLYGSNLATNATPAINIAGQPANILYASPGQINLVIPPGLPPGPALLALNNGALNAYPVVVNIDTPPAGIDAVQNSTGAYIYSAQAAHPGDTLIVTLSNFAAVGSTIPPGQVQVSVGGVSYTPTQIVQVSTVWQVTIVLDSRVPLGTSEPLIVYLNGRSSLPANIPIAAAAN